MRIEITQNYCMWISNAELYRNQARNVENMGKISYSNYVKYNFCCTDFDETHNCTMALYICTATITFTLQDAYSAMITFIQKSICITMAKCMYRGPIITLFQRVIYIYITTFTSRNNCSHDNNNMEYV
jgi:hypothetical protein